MTDHPDRQRLRPTVEGRARLLAAIEVAGSPHVVDAGTLGEYAELIAVRGQAHADATLPAVAAHLASGCPGCADDLRELAALAAEPDTAFDASGYAASHDDGPQSPPHAGDGSPPDPPPPLPRKAVGTSAEPMFAPRSGGGPMGAQRRSPADSEGGMMGPGVGAGPPDDSGIYAVDLPDVRAAEAEAARRQRLRRLRDWLLVAAAAAILLMGLSLVGLAYVASRQPDARLGLTPVPGRAAPNGMACPGSHPLKGNRASMIYHPPGGEFYDATRPEDCFAAPADAEAAGYRRSAR